MTEDLTKVTVNLVPRSMDALEAAAELTYYTRTDVVNRALQLYQIVHQAATRAEATELMFETGERQIRLVVFPMAGQARRRWWQVWR